MTEGPRSEAPGYPYVILFILVTELCERFAFYGFTGSLVCFFKTLGFPSDLATELISLFGSIVYLTPVLGAYIADVYLGRFKTIAIFCAIYIIGLALTTAGAWPTDGDNAIPREMALGFTMVGLFAFVTIGAGGIKSNVVVLGADQFKLPEQEHHQASFFNFFYWCINIGATGAFLFLTNVALYGLGDLIPPRFGFFASFAIPLAAFVVALLAFVAGERRYVQRPPEGVILPGLERLLWPPPAAFCPCSG
jgi:peptide/histidine transporter 3/4